MMGGSLGILPRALNETFMTVSLKKARLLKQDQDQDHGQDCKGRGRGGRAVGG